MAAKDDNEDTFGGIRMYNFTDDFSMDDFPRAVIPRVSIPRMPVQKVIHSREAIPESYFRGYPREEFMENDLYDDEMISHYSLGRGLLDYRRSGLESDVDATYLDEASRSRRTLLKMKRRISRSCCFGHDPSQEEQEASSELTSGSHANFGLRTRKSLRRYGSLPQVDDSMDDCALNDMMVVSPPVRDRSCFSPAPFSQKRPGYESRYAKEKVQAPVGTQPCSDISKALQGTDSKDDEATPGIHPDWSKDSEIKQGTEADWSKDSETKQGTESDSSKDSETKQGTESDSSKDSETQQGTEADSSKDSETQQGTDLDWSKDSETKQGTEADSSKDSETQQGTEADWSKDSETKQGTESDSSKDSETKQGTESDSSKDSETKQGTEADSSKDSETKQDEASNEKCTEDSECLRKKEIAEFAKDLIKTCGKVTICANGVDILCQQKEKLETSVEFQFQLQIREEEREYSDCEQDESDLEDMESFSEPDISDSSMEISIEGGQTITLNTQREKELFVSAMADAAIVSRKDPGVAECCRIYTQVFTHLGLDVNFQDDKGNTLLMKAVRAGNLSLLELLITEKAELDLRNDLGRTAFAYAARMNRIQFMVILKAAGADINLTDNIGRSPLMQMISSRKKCACFEAFKGPRANLEIEDNKKKNALVLALERGIGVTRVVLDLGANPCLRPEFHHLFMPKENNGMEQFDMVQCVSTGDSPLVRLLVCNGAVFNPPKQFPEYFDSPLGRALINSKPDIAKYLVATGYVTDHDLSDLRRLRRATTQGQDIENMCHGSKDFLREAASHPWPLVKLATIAVSTHIGHGPGRRERVLCLPLPNRMKDIILFQVPITRLQTKEWKDIQLCFDPQDYDAPERLPLLYQWPLKKQPQVQESDHSVLNVSFNLGVNQPSDELQFDISTLQTMTFSVAFEWW